MNIYRIKINNEKSLAFHHLKSAIDCISCFVEEDRESDNLGENHYELSYSKGENEKLLLKLPQEDLEEEDNGFHPLLQEVLNITTADENGFVHEINHRLKKLEELEENKYTIIPGNDNFLDLIELADLTEYCKMYCPTCKKIQSITVEGCRDELLFICDECDQIVTEAYRHECVINKEC
jgi:hypothetical protein